MGINGGFERAVTMATRTDQTRTDHTREERCSQQSSRGGKEADAEGKRSEGEEEHQPVAGQRLDSTVLLLCPIPRFATI